MICPICKKEMHETESWFHCLSCHVYFFPQIKNTEDSEYKSEFFFNKKSYSISEFERYCKLKAFW